MTKIKICGITNKVDAKLAAGLGVDMIGFIFYNKSKRYVEPHAAKDIASQLPLGIEKVGVFVDEKKESVWRIAEDVRLDILQFHGDESPEYCDCFKDKYKVIKAFRLKDKNSLKKVNNYNVNFYLFDTYKRDLAGGTGKTFDWGILKDFESLKTPVILSGGLTVENVLSAVKKLAPYAVDVSTGIEESPGEKDPVLMKRFVENIRKAD